MCGTSCFHIFRSPKLATRPLSLNRDNTQRALERQSVFQWPLMRLPLHRKSQTVNIFCCSEGEGLILLVRCEREYVYRAFRPFRFQNCRWKWICKVLQTPSPNFPKCSSSFHRIPKASLHGPHCTSLNGDNKGPKKERFAKRA